METMVAGAAKQAWPWTATLAIIWSVPLSDWVMILTAVYTCLQIALSIRKWFKDK